MCFGSVYRTIGRPLIPTIKSNHGSIATCRAVFRRTWKPKEPCSLRRWGTSPSRRDMKRLSALNMVIVVSCASYDVKVRIWCEYVEVESVQRCVEAGGDGWLRQRSRCGLV